MWRRIAGGLTEERQMEIWQYLKPHFDRKLAPIQAKHVPKPKGIQPEGFDEMVRLAAALEHLPESTKRELGDSIARRMEGSAPSGGPWMWVNTGADWRARTAIWKRAPNSRSGESVGMAPVAA